MKVSFHYGKIDLQKLTGVDAVVCPTDRFLSGAGGLDQAIHTAAGPGLAKELQGKTLQNGEILLTGGYDLGVDWIVHAAVPPCMKPGELVPLRQCYRQILDVFCAEYLTKHSKQPHTCAITLLGTGHCGWSYEDSMAALWAEVLDFACHHTSRYFGGGWLEELRISYPQDAHHTVWSYQNRASQAFFNPPDQWGMRGDPHFWYGLMYHFDDPRFNSIEIPTFVAEIQRFFHEKAGKWLCGDTEVYLEEYAHGGMTSGMISGFMAEIGIPILCSNLVELGFLEDHKPHFVIPVELHSMHQEKYRLKLPYELLPLLEKLRLPGASEPNGPI